MNGRQAAKAAAKRIEELEYVGMRQMLDVQQYVACVHGMIEGNSPCPYCEDYEECQLEAKDGKGCTQWWLKFPKEEEINAGKCAGTEAREGG